MKKHIRKIFCLLILLTIIIGCSANPGNTMLNQMQDTEISDDLIASLSMFQDRDIIRGFEIRALDQIVGNIIDCEKIDGNSHKCEIKGKVDLLPHEITVDTFDKNTGSFVQTFMDIKQTTGAEFIDSLNLNISSSQKAELLVSDNISFNVGADVVSKAEIVSENLPPIPEGKKRYVVLTAAHSEILFQTYTQIEGNLSGSVSSFIKVGSEFYGKTGSKEKRIVVSVIFTELRGSNNDNESNISENTNIDGETEINETHLANNKNKKDLNFNFIEITNFDK